MLDQKVNPHTNKNEFCLVSKNAGKVLKWFGPHRPTDDRIAKEERRIEYFKHQTRGGK